MKSLFTGFLAAVIIAGFFFSGMALSWAKEKKDDTSPELQKVDPIIRAVKAKEEKIEIQKSAFEPSVRHRRHAKKAALKQKKDKERWSKILKNTKSVLTLVHNDQFVIKQLSLKENFYIPEASLSLDPSSVANYSHKLSHHFAFVDGPSVLLHLETFYYDEHGVVYPNYVLQLNFEIPQELFRNRQTLSSEELKGYMAWVHPDFPNGDLFLNPSAGHLYLWRIKKGYLMGLLDMEFNHEKLKTPIHLYGKVRAYQMTKEEYAASQAAVVGKIAMDQEALDSVPINRDRLRPPHDYKDRNMKDPWLKGRSSSLWEAPREGLKP